MFSFALMSFNCANKCIPVGLLYNFLNKYQNKDLYIIAVQEKKSNCGFQRALESKAKLIDYSLQVVQADSIVSNNLITAGIQKVTSFAINLYVLYKSHLRFSFKHDIINLTNTKGFSSLIVTHLDSNKQFVLTSAHLPFKGKEQDQGNGERMSALLRYSQQYPGKSLFLTGDLNFRRKILPDRSAAYDEGWRAAKALKFTNYTPDNYTCRVSENQDHTDLKSCKVRGCNTRCINSHKKPEYSNVYDCSKPDKKGQYTKTSHPRLPSYCDRIMIKNTNGVHITVDDNAVLAQDWVIKHFDKWESDHLPIYASGQITL
ncbi:endonuclease/exonuclease/phosphatase family protein [Tetraselmis virus 1]|uniref:Endonuclease/exonuclease/phosphatase family protein n=1 Tax=Tetraselmis virus 1 TaxID=2060617 RepID=A0A2P0VP39_9VIRU|nr:endonuclease/exonuclease/phosphatase family protein [Tetraselmis virus 1]AUF82686.1 endonuclease/exonuclease/phosphatase family protein [Tetraselmis virus 1]